jgi:RecA-family ATPase
MLLCTEALDLNGGEAMVWLSEEMGYTSLFPNRVELWKRRCYNPLRRTTRRGALVEQETDALIRILNALADRLYPMVRSLLSSAESPEVTEQRWGLFRSRLAELIKERFNLRRGGVQRLLDPVEGRVLSRQLVQALAFSAGPGGFERLKASLQDAAA